MATTIRNTRYTYPPRPASGAGTFSDNIVGLQIVDGGGLTQGNFEFTTGVIEKVNRTFGVGAFQAPVSLEDLKISNTLQSQLISKQFAVYPNFDYTQVLNFALYGSLAKRLSVSVTKIINYFPAALDVMFTTPDFSQGNTAVNILYDQVNDETYFEVNVDRIMNPFAIQYSLSSTTLNTPPVNYSKYRILFDTYLDYAISVNDVEYKVQSFQPSTSQEEGYIAFYVSGSPFGVSATSVNTDFLIRPNDFIVDKIFAEDFDEVEKFLLNRLVLPMYTATFQVPAQNTIGEFYVNYQNVTFPKDGVWNLDIRTVLFDDYLTLLQSISETLDSFKTNLLSRFLTADSLKEFDTLGRKVEKVFQLYGRSFDEIKKFIDGLAFMTSVNYNPSNDIPSELLVDLAQTLGWNGNFSPIIDKDYLLSIFGNQSKPNYPGYTRALTDTELNYSFYRSLILNSGYLFRSKGTRRSVEFLLNLIGAPEALIEYNEHIYKADQPINLDSFQNQFARISGGTYVDERPALQKGRTFRLRGRTFTAFTTNSLYQEVSVRRNQYPFDSKGYPYAPKDTDDFFFQKGAGWYEQTPQHRSPEKITITGNVFTGQNTNIQTQLIPFSYGQEYLNTFRKFPYINEGFKLLKTIDNNKSWVSTDDRLRSNTNANYNAYYFISDERLALNVKNVDLFLNPGQGLSYEIWQQSRINNYPIPETGLTVNYPVPGGVDSTFVNPQPQRKTFFEFSQTFWQNMINTRNRQFITDGKTGGYPTLQSLWWNYLQQFENTNTQNYKYDYQKLIQYVQGIGPVWMKLVEQMIPATTIWQTGTRFENSILHRQKFVYRRQRGCKIVPLPTLSCLYTTNLTPYSLVNEKVEMFIYPWLNGNLSVSNFNGILTNRVNTLLSQNGYNQSTCTGINNLVSDWFVDLRIGSSDILIRQQFYTGYGINDVPTNGQWKLALINNLPQIIQRNLTYHLDGNKLTITNLGTQTLNLSQNLTLSVGININVTC